jgi:hypothetical protein
MKSCFIPKKELTESINPIYYIAHKLKDSGFSIEFSLTNISLTHKDIKFNYAIEWQTSVNGDLIFIEREKELK